MDKKIGNLQATMDEQMDAFRNKMTGMLKENHELKEKIDRLEDKMDDLEGRSRRNNLIFHGIPSPEGQTELWSDCEKAVRKVLREEMGVAEDVELERAHRLRGGGKSPRPIIACFSKFKDKERVLANRKMLREKKSSIFVNEDFTPRKRAFFRFDPLVIEGKAHTFDPATQKLVPRQGQP
ncbi:hypothetical protein ACOMHN_043445 [Nucella lapillus]